MLANLKLEAVSYTKSNLTTVFSVLPVQEVGREGREGLGFFQIHLPLVSVYACQMLSQSP